MAHSDTSNECGDDQVWMRDFPVPQGKWNISRGRARAPRWSPDGRLVYFWRGSAALDTLFRVRRFGELRRLTAGKPR